MKQLKPLALFFLLVLASAAIIEGAILAFGFTQLLALSIMWSIGLAAMAALKLSGQDLSSLGWGWGQTRYHVIAFALPIIYGAVAYGVAGAAGLADFASGDRLHRIVESQGFQTLPFAIGVFLSLLLASTVGMIGSMASALGEEIGWRGFLTPRLTALTGFVAATLITGLIWASWHLPVLIFSDYNAGGDKGFEVASFMVMIVAISGPFAWLRLASGSLWPAATLHASHNLFLQSIYDPLSERGAHTVTMVGEFGVVTAVASVLVCLPFWILGARRFTGASSSAH